MPHTTWNFSLVLLLTYRLRNTRAFTKKNCRRIRFHERIYYRIITYRNSSQKKHMTAPREHVLLNKRWTEYTLQMSILTSTFIPCTAAKEVHFASAIQKTYILVHATYHFWLNGLGYLQHVYRAMMEGCGNKCVLDVRTCRLQNTRHYTKKYNADSLKKHMTQPRDHLPFNKQLQSSLCS